MNSNPQRQIEYRNSIMVLLLLLLLLLVVAEAVSLVSDLETLHRRFGIVWEYACGSTCGCRWFVTPLLVILLLCRTMVGVFRTALCDVTAKQPNKIIIV